MQEDQALDVVDDVGNADFRCCSGSANGAANEAHSRFLLGKDVFDMAMDFGLAAICDAVSLGHLPAFRLLVVNAGDEAILLHELLIGLRAIGGIGPDGTRLIVLVEQPLARSRSFISGSIGCLPLADQTEPPVDRDVVLESEGRNGDIDRRFRAVGPLLRPREFGGPALG